MAKLFVQAQATSNRSEYVFVQDSASTTGGGKTGIAYNASGFTAYYVRPAGSATAITLATQTVTGAWSSGGWVEVDATNLPGIYRFDIPNAVFATGVDHAVVMLKGASGMAPVSLEYQIVGFDPSTAWLTSAQTASAVWGALTNDHTTHGTYGWNVLRADAPSKEGVVTLHQSSGISRIDADIHAIVNDADAAAELKGALLHTGGDYITANLLTPVTGATSVHIGPYQLLADGLGASDALDIQQTTAQDIAVRCVDANGSGVSLSGATVTAKVYNSAGTLVATYNGTVTYAADGWLTFGLTTAVTNTVGTYTITITRTTSATDTSIYGPLRMYVRGI